jgi:uncharacterized protein YbjT (DUF2867 family)
MSETSARDSHQRPVLVLGASGYMGRHLVPRLVREGYRVRAAARRLDAMAAEGWTDVEQVQVDARDPESLRPAFQGVGVVYHLIHSMAVGARFPEHDRVAARNVAAVAAETGVARIVYLGGLAPPNPDTPHLASRVETGEILRRGSVPVTELRAGIIVGPGSAAFEVMRDLVAYVPIFVAPRWINRRTPPIALSELLDELVALPNVPAAAGGIYDTGGPSRLSYVEMMRVLAHAMGRRPPVVIPVPGLTPELVSHGLALVSATPPPVARALITGLKYELRADDRALRELLPAPRIDFAEAVRRAFQAETQIVATDRWREGAFNLRGHRHDISFYAKRLTRTAETSASPEAAWRALSRLGTRRDGYFFLNSVWRLRFALDRLVGGRPADPRPDGAGPPEADERFDVWRVLAAVPPVRLTLISRLVAPGMGGMAFEIGERGDGGARLSATIHWHPAGWPGLVYWYALGPMHALMLRGLVRALARRARKT